MAGIDETLVIKALERLGGHGYYQPQDGLRITIYDMVKNIYEEEERGHIYDVCLEKGLNDFCSDFDCEKCEGKEWFVYDINNKRTSRTFKASVRDALHERDKKEEGKIFIDLSPNKGRGKGEGHWGLRNYEVSVEDAPPDDNEETPENSGGRSEGKESMQIHKLRERNAKLVKMAKDLFKTNNDNKVFCELCSFQFSSQYTSNQNENIGEDFIEAHHMLPLNKLKEEKITYIWDLMLLCPNCHRMVHRLDGCYSKGAIRRALSIRKEWGK